MKKNLPLFFLALFCFIAGGLASFLIFGKMMGPKAGTAITLQNNPAQSTSSICGSTSTRINGYKFIKPLLFGDQNCESPALAEIKRSVMQVVDSLKSSGHISSASVYLRQFEHGAWMGLNEYETYHPGSLFKVPIMLAYLHEAEENPGLLDKELVFNLPEGQTLPPQNYHSKSIQAGKKYSIRELLRYTISYSDNNAYWLLKQHIDEKQIDDIFVNLGIGVPMHGDDDGRVRTTVKEFSAFMKTLFNSSYLRPQYSEYAMSLLADCEFKEGFVQGLPMGTQVAHKFGEWDDGVNFELHESGIFYIQDKAYLLSIMTKGENRANLPKAISWITRTIHDHLRGA